MSGHTPGPWIGIGPLPVVGGGRAFAVQAAGGFTVALVGANDTDLASARADVLLIEAAPDLLAALKRFVAEDDGPEAWSAARAAIAKAEAES